DLLGADRCFAPHEPVVAPFRMAARAAETAAQDVVRGVVKERAAPGDIGRERLAEIVALPAVLSVAVLEIERHDAARRPALRPRDALVLRERDAARRAARARAVCVVELEDPRGLGRRVDRDRVELNEDVVALARDEERMRLRSINGRARLNEFIDARTEEARL